MAALIRHDPIKSRNVISRIRKATRRAVTLEKGHSFAREFWGRYWVFAHNGDRKEDGPCLHGSFRPVGQTDSEHAAPGDRVVVTTPLTTHERWTLFAPGELKVFVDGAVWRDSCMGSTDKQAVQYLFTARARPMERPLGVPFRMPYRVPPFSRGMS